MRFVLAQEQRLHRGELDVLVRADVAGHKAAAGIGHRQIAGSGFQLAFDKRPQTIGRSPVGPVHHRAIDPRRDIGNLLARIRRAGAARRIKERAKERNRLRTRSQRIKICVASRYGNAGRRCARRGQVDVVVEKLSPHIDEC